MKAWDSSGISVTFYCPCGSGASHCEVATSKLPWWRTCGPWQLCVCTQAHVCWDRKLNCTTTSVHLRWRTLYHCVLWGRNPFFSGLQRRKLKLRKDRWHIQSYTVSTHALSFFLYGRKCNSLLHSLKHSLKISTQVKKGLSHQWNLLPLVKSLSSSILCVCRILFLQSFILLARNDKNPNLHLFDNFLLRNSVTTTPDNSKILQ